MTTLKRKLNPHPALLHMTGQLVAVAILLLQNDSPKAEIITVLGDVQSSLEDMRDLVLSEGEDHATLG